MSLLHFTESKFTPTQNQNDALMAIDDFLKSDLKCFLLKGYAGTGKTTITKYIADYLDDLKLKVHLMAPTGRAARILSLKTKHNSTTIHKGIYNLDRLDEIVINKNGKEQFKFRYNLNKVENNVQNVYLIDEASMISDYLSESDFFIFGSGHLLTDLLTFIAPLNKARNDKIIFIGDPAQLPPVTDKISGALSASYLLEKHQIETREIELTEVVRQAKGSGILLNATYLRNQLSNANKNSFELDLKHDDIQKLEPADVVDYFLDANPALLPERSVIINYSNRSALDYNLAIREKKFADKMQIEVSDTLMINQNNYNYGIELLNGMMVKVKAVSPVPEIKSGMLSYDAGGNDIRVTHKFRRITIELSENGKLLELSCMILENFLYSPEPGLNYAENIALYLDFKIRHPHLRPKTKEFTDALRKDPYFNALRVKYGYAITCHKAQGGEWEAPIVNLDCNMGKLSDHFLRWAYTAITRAGKKLILVNIPKSSRFSLLKYQHKLINKQIHNPHEMPHEMVFRLPANMVEIHELFGLSDSENFKQQKFIEILAVAESENICVTGRRENPFQEVYVFKKNESKAELIFYYNGKNQFTRIVISGKETNDQSFASELQLLFSKQVNIRVEEKEIPTEEFPSPDPEPLSNEEIDLLMEKLFPEQHGAHRILYHELSAILQPENIQIVSVEHKSYQELYTFCRNEEIAVIRFYYDGLNRFTQCEPLIDRCNSNTLLTELNEVMIFLQKL